MTRAAIYARYSSDNQREASIQDQTEVCRRYCDARGWEATNIYEDRALSAASAARPGYQALLRDARQRLFDVVVAESLDRLSRRVADVANLHDELAFQRIQFHTVATGEVTALLAGILGTIGQQYLVDLKDKTWRGLLGRVLAGRSAGGLAYGYRIPEGETGRREIQEPEARVVRRIFEDYATGRSPRTIARTLNAEGIPGPGGRPWGDTTIRGQVERGTGILNNALYVGRLEWNRCSYVKDPRTGRRVARPNPPERWEVVEVPELRIVDDALWQRVKDRQQAAGFKIGRDGQGNALNRAHRRRFLLSGLLECGDCAGGYTIMGKDRYGCAAHRSRGTCSNTLTIRRQEIESRVLDGLKERLLAPDLFEAFAKEYRDEIERLHREHRHHAVDLERRLQAVRRRIASIVAAVEDGLYNPSMKERLDELETQKAATEAELAAVPEEPKVRLHPDLPKLYAAKVAHLRDALDDPAIREEAAEVLRSLIDKVVLTPTAGRLAAELRGDLAAILSMCEAGSKQELPGTDIPGSQLSVVAGARNRLDLLLSAFTL